MNHGQTVAVSRVSVPDGVTSALGQEMPRRTLLKLSAGAAAGLVGLLVQQAFNNNIAYARQPGFREASALHPGYLLIWHNVADSPAKLRESLTLDVLPEVDVLSYAGRLYVADNATALRHLNSRERRTQRLENILVEIAGAGRNPAIDVKISDAKRLSDLETAVDALVPRDALVVVSGTYTSVTNMKLAGRRNLVLVPTVGPARENSYYRDAEQWRRNPGAVLRGATLRESFARQSRILEFNVERGLQTNVYGIRDEADAAYFISRGATLITTDKAALLSRARGTAQGVSRWGGF